MRGNYGWSNCFAQEENRPEQTWLASGWAYRQVLDDILNQHPGDSEMVAKLTLSKDYPGLTLRTLNPKLAARIKTAIEQIASGIPTGTMRSGILDMPFGDKSSVEGCHEALQQLLKYIAAAGRPVFGTG
jgi:hypothetical protein